MKKKVRKRNNSERGEERKRSPKVITSNVTRLKRIPQFGRRVNRWSEVVDALELFPQLRTWAGLGSIVNSNFLWDIVSFEVAAQIATLKGRLSLSLRANAPQPRGQRAGFGEQSS